MHSQLSKHTSPPAALAQRETWPPNSNPPNSCFNHRRWRTGTSEIKLLLFTSGSMSYIWACLKHDVHDGMEDKSTLKTGDKK